MPVAIHIGVVTKCLPVPLVIGDCELSVGPLVPHIKVKPIRQEIGKLPAPCFRYPAMHWPVTVKQQTVTVSPDTFAKVRLRKSVELILHAGNFVFFQIYFGRTFPRIGQMRLWSERGFWEDEGRTQALGSDFSPPGVLELRQIVQIIVKN